MTRTHPPGTAQAGLTNSGVLAFPADVVAFQDRFFRLLQKRTAIYTMGDSSSVPRHVAIDLLRSVCFVLGIDADEPEIPDELLTVDLEAEFGRRLASIGRKVEATAKLWREACVSMPVIQNIALRDTLASIGDFAQQYDYRSMAHEITCSIDYPLCHPVPESLLGVEYIYEYLRRLLLEGEFLQHFALASCVGILESTCPDYRGLLVNLYEPIATNAIGRAVIGQDPVGLNVTDADRTEIARRLGPLGPNERIRVLHKAALTVCDAVGIQDDGAREYLTDLVPELLPRIDIGLARDDLRGVFVAMASPVGTDP